MQSQKAFEIPLQEAIQPQLSAKGRQYNGQSFSAENDDRTIHIANLTASMDDLILAKEFSKQFGEVENVSRHFPPTKQHSNKNSQEYPQGGISHSFGFVLFKHLQDAFTAVQAGEVMIGDRKIAIRQRTRRPFNKQDHRGLAPRFDPNGSNCAIQPYMPTDLQHMEQDRITQPGHVAMKHVSTSQFRMKSGQKFRAGLHHGNNMNAALHGQNSNSARYGTPEWEEGRSVVVYNLSRGYTTEHLYSDCSAYGLVVRADVYRQPNDANDTTRAGCVVMESYSDARKLINQINSNEMIGGDDMPVGACLQTFKEMIHRLNTMVPEQEVLMSNATAEDRTWGYPRTFPPQPFSHSAKPGNQQEGENQFQTSHWPKYPQKGHLPPIVQPPIHYTQIAELYNRGVSRNSPSDAYIQHNRRPGCAPLEGYIPSIARHGYNNRINHSQQSEYATPSSERSDEFLLTQDKQFAKQLPASLPPRPVKSAAWQDQGLRAPQNTPQTGGYSRNSNGSPSSELSLASVCTTPSPINGLRKISGNTNVTSVTNSTTAEADAIKDNAYLKPVLYSTSNSPPASEHGDFPEAIAENVNSSKKVESKVYNGKSADEVTESVECNMLAPFVYKPPNNKDMHATSTANTALHACLEANAAMHAAQSTVHTIPLAARPIVNHLEAIPGPQIQPNPYVVHESNISMGCMIENTAYPLQQYTGSMLPKEQQFGNNGKYRGPQYKDNAIYTKHRFTGNIIHPGQQYPGHIVYLEQQFVPNNGYSNPPFMSHMVDRSRHYTPAMIPQGPYFANNTMCIPQQSVQDACMVSLPSSSPELGHTFVQPGFVMVPERETPWDPCELFVRGFDDNIIWTQADFKNLFIKYGEIDRITFETFPNGRPKGCGLIRFKSPEDAARAKNCLAGQLSGPVKRLYVVYAEPHDERSRRLAQFFNPTTRSYSSEISRRASDSSKESKNLVGGLIKSQSLIYGSAEYKNLIDKVDESKTSDNISEESQTLSNSFDMLQSPNYNVYTSQSPSDRSQASQNLVESTEKSKETTAICKKLEAPVSSFKKSQKIGESSERTKNTGDTSKGTQGFRAGFSDISDRLTVVVGCEACGHSNVIRKASGPRFDDDAAITTSSESELAEVVFTGLVPEDTLRLPVSGPEIDRVAAEELAFIVGTEPLVDVEAFVRQSLQVSMNSSPNSSPPNQSVTVEVDAENCKTKLEQDESHSSNVLTKAENCIKSLNDESLSPKEPTQTIFHASNDFETQNEKTTVPFQAPFPVVDDRTSSERYLTTMAKSALKPSIVKIVIVPAVPPLEIIERGIRSSQSPPFSREPSPVCLKGNQCVEIASLNVITSFTNIPETAKDASAIFIPKEQIPEIQANKSEGIIADAPTDANDQVIEKEDSIHGRAEASVIKFSASDTKKTISSIIAESASDESRPFKIIGNSLHSAKDLALPHSNEKLLIHSGFVEEKPCEVLENVSHTIIEYIVPAANPPETKDNTASLDTETSSTNLRTLDDKEDFTNGPANNIVTDLPTTHMLMDVQREMGSEYISSENYEHQSTLFGAGKSFSPMDGSTNDMPVTQNSHNKQVPIPVKPLNQVTDKLIQCPWNSTKKDKKVSHREQLMPHGGPVVQHSSRNWNGQTERPPQKYGNDLHWSQYNGHNEPRLVPNDGSGQQRHRHVPNKIMVQKPRSQRGVPSIMSSRVSPAIHYDESAYYKLGPAQQDQQFRGSNYYNPPYDNYGYNSNVAGNYSPKFPKNQSHRYDFNREQQIDAHYQTRMNFVETVNYNTYPNQKVTQSACISNPASGFSFHPTMDNKPLRTSPTDFGLPLRQPQIVPPKEFYVPQHQRGDLPHMYDNGSERNHFSGGQRYRGRKNSRGGNMTPRHVQDHQRYAQHAPSQQGYLPQTHTQQEFQGYSSHLPMREHPHYPEQSIGFKQTHNAIGAQARNIYNTY